MTQVEYCRINYLIYFNLNPEFIFIPEIIIDKTLLVCERVGVSPYIYMKYVMDNQQMCMISEYESTFYNNKLDELRIEYYKKRKEKIKKLLSE